MKKEFYVSPETKTVGTQVRRVVCESPTDVKIKPFGDEEDDDIFG